MTSTDGGAWSKLLPQLVVHFLDADGGAWSEWFLLLFVHTLVAIYFLCLVETLLRLYSPVTFR